MKLSSVLLVLGSAISYPAASLAQGGDPTPVTDTVTFHIDSQRTGWNQTETTLTPDNVSGPGFGPLWNSPQLDLVNIGGTDYAPHLYASPLYVDNVTLSGDAYGGCSSRSYLPLRGTPSSTP